MTEGKRKYLELTLYYGSLCGIAGVNKPSIFLFLAGAGYEMALVILTFILYNFLEKDEKNKHSYVPIFSSLLFVVGAFSFAVISGNAFHEYRYSNPWEIYRSQLIFMFVLLFVIHGVNTAVDIRSGRSFIGIQREFVFQVLFVFMLILVAMLLVVNVNEHWKGVVMISLVVVRITGEYFLRKGVHWLTDGK